jgi:hypothetical protein
MTHQKRRTELSLNLPALLGFEDSFYLHLQRIDLCCYVQGEESPLLAPVLARFPSLRARVAD